jgi:hypothetical protein
MNIKITLAVLALMGQTDAAWKATSKVFSTSGFGTTYSKPESSFTSKQKKFGYVNRIEHCSDTFNTKVEWDLGNICEPSSTIKYGAVVGDDSYFSSSNCDEVSLQKTTDECINAIGVYYSSSYSGNEIKGFSYVTTSGKIGVLGDSTSSI